VCLAGAGRTIQDEVQRQAIHRCLIIYGNLDRSGNAGRPAKDHLDDVRPLDRNQRVLPVAATLSDGGLALVARQREWPQREPAVLWIDRNDLADIVHHEIIRAAETLDCEVVANPDARETLPRSLGSRLVAVALPADLPVAVSLELREAGPVAEPAGPVLPGDCDRVLDLIVVGFAVGRSELLRRQPPPELNDGLAALRCSPAIDEV